MFGRISRRRLARAAIERLEQQHRAAKYVAEGAEERARASELAERAADADREQALQRLHDANAELARWGLEPIPRDVPESPEHPTRYRRSSDWRVTRSGDELVELLETYATCSPEGVDVTVAERGPFTPVPLAEPAGAELAAEAHRLRLELATVRGVHAQLLLTEEGLRESVAIAKAAMRDAQQEASSARAELGDALTAASEAEGQNVVLSKLVDELRAERDALIDSLPTRALDAEAEVERLQGERTAREEAERSRDRAVAKADQLGLELEALRAGEAFKVPAQGDTFTIRTRDGMGDVRCRVVNVAPVGDFGFSLMLEPAE